MTRWVRGRPTTRVWLPALASVVVFSFVLSAWTVVRQQNEQSLRAADRKALATSQVSLCYQQAKTAPAVLKLLGLIDILASNSLDGNREALKLAGPNDPLRPVRLRSVARLVPARKNLAAFITLTKQRSPTNAVCHTLAIAKAIDDSVLRKGVQ
jgi:hypothetical protein